MVPLKRILLPGLCIALLQAVPCLSDSFKAPAIPDGEVRVFNAYYSDPGDEPAEDDPIMKAIGEFTPVSYSGETRWQGQGNDRRLIYTRAARLKNGARTETVFNFETAPRFMLKEFTNVMWAPDGKKVADEYYDFTSPLLRYPEDTFHVVVGNMVLRGSDLAVGTEINFTVWLTSTMVYPFRYRVVGEDTITTPAGTFDCYRLEGELYSESLTDITGILINLATGKYTFWVEKQGAHGFVRLLWPVSSGVIPGRTRYQTQDLIEIRREQ